MKTHIRRANQWYWNEIPDTDRELAGYLANAMQLAKTFGVERVSSFNVGQKRDSNYDPLSGVVTVPSWVLDTRFHQKTLDRKLSNSEANALKTALWNNAVMTAAAYHSAEIATPGKTLGERGTWSEWARRLRANQVVNDSGYSIFNQASVDFEYTLPDLLNADSLEKVLYAYLNPKLRSVIREALGDEAADLMDTIATSNSKHKRDKALRKLMELLQQDQEQQSGEDEQESQDDEQDQGSQNGDNGQQEESLGDKLQQAAQDQDFGDDAPQEHQFDSQQLPDSLKVGSLMERINDEARELAQRSGWDRFLHGQDITNTIDIDSYRIPGTTVRTDPRFLWLGSILRQIKTVVEPPVFPERRGIDLLDDELYRIRIDQKVMGEDLPEKQSVEKEIIILIDLSGSTMGSGLWLREAQAAKGAYLSLRDARDMVSVYGHNARDGNSLFEIVGPKTPNVDRRFNKISHALTRLGNYDHYVIKHLAKHGYVKPNTRKILIVLSDGQPCGPNGVELTKLAVDAARQQGVTVISMSLVESVIEDNDVIYGKQWNVDATDDLNQKMRDLVYQISQS